VFRWRTGSPLRHLLHRTSGLRGTAAARYTLCVSSIATELRRLTARQVLALTPDERIDLALALGDDDARLFIDASGLPVELASRRLRAARQVGRQRSVAAVPLAEV